MISNDVERDWLLFPIPRHIFGEGRMRLAQGKDVQTDEPSVLHSNPIGSHLKPTDKRTEIEECTNTYKRHPGNLYPGVNTYIWYGHLYSEAKDPIKKNLTSLRNRVLDTPKFQRMTHFFLGLPPLTVRDFLEKDAKDWMEDRPPPRLVTEPRDRPRVRAADRCGTVCTINQSIDQ